MYLAYGRKMAECQNLSDPMKFCTYILFSKFYGKKLCAILFETTKQQFFSLVLKMNKVQKKLFILENINFFFNKFKRQSDVVFSNIKKKLLEYLLALQVMGRHSSITRNLTQEKTATKIRKIDNICSSSFQIFEMELSNIQKFRILCIQP